MSFYVKRSGDWEQVEPLYRDCPHCGAHAELLLTAPPSFDHLNRSRPRHAGIVFECAACKEPRFARLAVRSFGPDRIELSSNVVDIERPREHFRFSYLPDRVAALLVEAFGCYTADLFLAFGMMCRRTIQAAIADSDGNGGPDLASLFADSVAFAELDAETGVLLETLLFDTAAAEPALDADTAAALIEILKDVLYQCYVRRSKLRAAVRMRRFFAGETSPKVTPIAAANRHANSA